MSCLGMVSTNLFRLFYAGEIQKLNCEGWKWQRTPEYFFFTRVGEICKRKQPIMRIEDRLFDRGWVRSAMAARKCGNIYFRKYFMAARKFTNMVVLLLIFMVGSRDTLFFVRFT